MYGLSNYSAGQAGDNLVDRIPDQDGWHASVGAGTNESIVLSSWCGTSRYRKRRAASAWFWVEAETCSVTARWVSKAAPAAAPISVG